MSNAQTTKAKPSYAEDYDDRGATRDQTLAYLSRYLFWLVMAVLLAMFSLVA